MTEVAAIRTDLAWEVARVRASLWRPFVIEKTWIDALERARRAGVMDDLETGAARR